MKLMNKTIEKRLPKLYTTEDIPLKEKVVQVKYFTPLSNWTWYATEYDPVEQLFFGLINGFELEWGYFSLAEFEDVNKDSLVLKIERDLYFTPCKIKDIPELKERL